MAKTAQVTGQMELNFEWNRFYGLYQKTMHQKDT